MREPESEKERAYIEEFAAFQRAGLDDLIPVVSIWEFPWHASCRTCRGERSSVCGACYTRWFFR